MPTSRLFPWVQATWAVIGPIPKGTPIGLIGNLEVLLGNANPFKRVVHAVKVAALQAELQHDLDLLALGPNPNDADSRKALDALAPFLHQLFELSKCPDYVVNRGHYFGTNKFPEEPALNDNDKRALIEFLKTF